MVRCGEGEEWVSFLGERWLGVGRVWGGEGWVGLGRVRDG